MLIVVLSFILYTIAQFFLDGISTDTAVIYIMLIAIFMVVNEIKSILKNK